MNYTKNDTNEGWEEHGVDISRLRRTELGPEPANDGAVERNLTRVLGTGSHQYEVAEVLVFRLA